jgi:restriction endonuclease S subunit
MAVWNTIQLSDIHPDRFDAEYFRKDYQDNIAVLKETGETTSIGRLFKYNLRGNQPHYHKNGTIKALRSVNVGFMNFNETRQEFVTEEFFKQNSRGKVQKDDILITSTGVGTLGRTSIWFYDEDAFCDGHITILRDGVLNPYFVTAFLNSKYGLIQFDQNFRGSSGQIEIYPYDISKFVIPECLFPYQEEIGEKVRRAFNAMRISNELKKNVEQEITLELGLQNFKKDNDKFRITNFSELTNTHRIDAQCFKPEFLQYELFIRENRSFEKLSDLLQSIQKGQQQNTTKNANFPYVSIKDIFGLDVVSKDSVSRKMTSSGREDLLLAVTGATIGKIGINHRYDSLSYSGDILNLKVNKNKISPWYLLAILNSPVGQTQFNRWITGSTNGHLSPYDVKKIIVPRLEQAIENKIEADLKTSLEKLQESERLIKESVLLVENLIKNNS